MQRKTGYGPIIGLLLGAFALGVPALAAQDTGPMGASPGMQQMPGMMQDMSKEMGKMSEQMSGGGMSPDMQKQMAERMRQMSSRMQMMSGMKGKGMMDADSQKHMKQMCQDMMGEGKGSHGAEDKHGQR